MGVITQQTFEMECCIELNKESGWGKRLHGQKMSLAGVVEGKLKDADKLVTAALPTESQAGRFRKQTPKLEMPPDPKIVGRAMTLMGFMAEARHHADHGGYSAVQTKVMEKLAAMIEHYVDEVLDIVRNGDADKEIAREFLLVAAGFTALIRDDKAGDLVRRRAMAACRGDTAAEA